MRLHIINCPIEPLEERYSIQWDKWFSEQFQKHQIKFFDTVYGEPTIGKIKHGSFLDVIETNIYKTSQLRKILEILSFYKDDEKLVLFFHDLWFPGLLNIAYMRDGLGFKNLRICGCLHAGSYDEYDFLNKSNMTPWAGSFENSLFQIVDEVYLATKFHEALISNDRIFPLNKSKITGFPLYPDFIKKANIPLEKREKQIIFPHRLDPEKVPELFDEFSHDPTMKNLTWLKTKDVCSTKQDYYDLLQNSYIALSFAKQETWGIAMQEAVICGALPICPNRLSYTELYNKIFLYDGFIEAKNKIKHFIQYPPIRYLHRLQTDILRKGAEAIPNIITNIKSL